jgi:hypothetical protein
MSPTIKDTYSFIYNDSEITISDLEAMVLAETATQAELDARIILYDSWLDSAVLKERIWRNKELRQTDYMLLSDASYDGVPLAGSQRLTEILAYRAELRLYDLRINDRPVRPVWFIWVPEN